MKKRPLLQRIKKRWRMYWNSPGCHICHERIDLKEDKYITKSTPSFWFPDGVYSGGYWANWGPDYYHEKCYEARWVKPYEK